MDLTNAQKWMLVYARVVSDAWSNATLREKLKQEPAKTILELYGYKIPEPIEIKFEEVSDASFQDYSLEDFEVFNNPSTTNIPLVYKLVAPPDTFEDGYNNIKGGATIGNPKCCCACF